jgi:alkyldihydroxyacetonephosphate synthase
MPPIRGASPFGGGRGETDRIIPAARPIPTGEEESLDVWGFRGAGFELLENGSVILHGARYTGSGVELPDLLPWVRKILDVAIQPGDIHRSDYPPAIPSPRPNPGFLREIEEVLPQGAVSSDAELRLRHGHGHSLEEMWAIKYGRIDRVPDLIAPFALERFYTDNLIGEKAAAAVSH